MNIDRVRHDFDRIAELDDGSDAGSARYDRFLLSEVPLTALRILEVGCGAGRLANELASSRRSIVAVDLSPAMIARAAATARANQVQFVCGDFLQLDLDLEGFDCILSAATLHHMPAELALARMRALVKPGGRIIVHDLRRGEGIIDGLAMAAILSHEAALRLFRTGWPLSPGRARKAWRDHAAGDVYLTIAQAEALFARCLPGARVRSHRGWRYTGIWDSPADWRGTT